MLPVTLHQAAMSPESTTDAAIQLQKNDELDRKCVITLPKLEAAGEKAESETKNSAKDAGEEDKSSGVTKDEAVDGDVSSSESNENKSFFDEVKEGFQKRVAAFWGLFVAEKEESTTQKAIANPAPGISKVLIAATGKKEGYDNADADEQNRTFSFQMKIQADQDYLDKVFEDSSKDPNFPKMDNFGNEQNYAQAIEDYFTDNEKISPVSYTYSLGDDFKLPDGQSMPFERELKNEYTGETLGKIIFAEDANGLMTATVVFEKKIYAMIMEEVALTQSLVIKADRLSTDKQILGWTGEGLILKSSSGPVPSENPEDKKAQIVKAGKTNDTGTEFTYIIDVSAPASGDFTGRCPEVYECG